MTDRKLLILFSTGVLVVGGLLWFLALSVARPSGRSSDTSKSSPMAATSSALPGSKRSSAGVQTMVETPAQKLSRAQSYLEPPVTRESLRAAELIVKNITPSTVEYKQGQKLLKAAEARLSKDEADEAIRLRGQLQVEYERLLSTANPHLNYITTKLTKHKGGFALWGVHTYFSQYTFSIGDDAKIVSAWIDQNNSDLKKAGILRVGVMSKEDWGGWCWFDLH